MTTIGDVSDFAISYSISDRVNDWTYGAFLFHVNGRVVGDRSDSATLKGCCGALRKRIARPPRPIDSQMIELSAQQFLEQVYIPSALVDAYDIAAYPDAHSRFNAAGLGMSSFDKFYVLLLDLPENRHRIVWCRRTRGVEFELPVYAHDTASFKAVALETVKRMEVEL